ncbi:hypothetical protein HDK64DRAFT_70722 [Phyllosticta capitalensis]
MSGIEVVGLVLGAVPITLLAIDGYLKLAESVERYRKYREKLSLLYNLLKIEHAIFHNNCKSLLRGIVSDSDAEKLIEDPRDNSDKWREQELELAFKNRLGTDYEPFMGTVIELNKVIGKFDKKLKVHNQDPERFLNRIKLSLLNKVYEDLLKELKNYNRTLSEFTQSILQLERQPAKQSAPPRLPDFSGLQRQASTIHSLIQCCFDCECSDLHMASIRLDRPREDVDRSSSWVYRFGVLFSYKAEPLPLESKSPWDIEAAEIAPFEQKDSLRSNNARPGVLSGRGRIKFVDPAPRAPPRACHSMPSVRIFDICKTLYTSKRTHDDVCVGYMINESEGDSKYGLFLQRLPKAQHMPYSFVSLQEIIASKSKFPQFGYPAKMKIAAAIANSMMKLYDTPWLYSFWKKEDIFFLKCGEKIKFDSPYIRKRKLKEGSRDDDSSTWTLHQPRDEVLYNLGILLTEICFETSFDEILEKARKTVDQMSLVIHKRPRKPLVQIVTDVSDKVGKKYSIAVERCLLCNFNRLHIGFDYEDFYNVFYSEVVSPLQISDEFLEGTDEF